MTAQVEVLTEAASATPMLEVSGLTRIFGPKQKEAFDLIAQGADRASIREKTGSTVAVRDVSFSVARGELFVVMGLSGSGKSTMVRMLNRLIEPSAGSILVDGQDINRVGVRELREIRNHKISMVFQHFALFPHRTVRQNAAYGLMLRGASAQEQREKADWALETVGLADRAEAKPKELSGGMQQRVGLARALAADTDIMLMDEPFSALDPLIRREMQELLIRLQRDLHKTIVFITHDLNEAMHLGDRILLLKDGQTVQLGTGSEIISSPADDYVADFVSDVDRSRVLTANDVIREPKLTARLGDSPDETLRRLGEHEANGVYVLDDDRCVVGVAVDDTLARAVQNRAPRLTRDHLVADYLTTRPGSPLIELTQLVGKHTVPLAVLDAGDHLIGVIPRAALLEALASRGGDNGRL